MKVLIADLPKAQNRDIQYEINLLKSHFPDVEAVIYNYDEAKKDEFKELLKDADVLLTALIVLDEDMLECAKKLRLISLTSTGFNFVDVPCATKKEIAVAAVGIVYGIQLVQVTMSQPSAALNIPYGCIYLSFPVSCIAMIIHELSELADLAACGMEAREGKEGA